jgi:hypothetical protein
MEKARAFSKKIKIFFFVPETLLRLPGIPGWRGRDHTRALSESGIFRAKFPVPLALRGRFCYTENIT